MLNSFRNAANSIIIKILFGGIIFSFVFWGVGDIIRNYSASKSVISVSKLNITVEQFLRQYSQEKQRVRNIGSKPLSDEEIAKIDIKGSVADNFVQTAVLDQTMADFGIVIPKKSLMGVVQSISEFQTDGVFDSRLYETAIKRSGMSEPGFLNQIRENLSRTQLLHPIIASYKIPAVILENIAKEFDSKKSIITAKISNINVDKNVSDKEIDAYYSENSAKYKEQESRDAAVLVIDYSSLSADLVVSKEEIDEYYLANKDSFEPAEKRSFERFVFDAKEDADKAWTLINKGVKTKDVIKKLTPEMEVVNNLDKSDLPENIGKELFSLKMQQGSPVYEIGSRFYIYRVVKIDAPKKRTDSQIKKEIELILQNEKMNSPEFYGKIKEMKNKIDDEFGSGKNIDEVSKSTGMKLLEFNGLRKGQASSSVDHAIKDEQTRTDILDAIFSTHPNEASATIDSREAGNISYVVFVRNVVPESVPNISKIKDKLKGDIILNRTEKKAKEEINKILENGNKAAEHIAKMKSASKYKFSKKDVILNKNQSNKDLERLLKDIPNPDVVLNILSSLKLGEATYLQLEDGRYMLVGLLGNEKVLNASDGFKTSLQKHIEVGMSRDAVAVSMGAFKSRLKVTINDKLLNEITKIENDTEGQ